jgi:hypothetical protein
MLSDLKLNFKYDKIIDENGYITEFSINKIDDNLLKNDFF